jgi:hypothetical protein
MAVADQSSDRMAAKLTMMWPSVNKNDPLTRRVLVSAILGLKSLSVRQLVVPALQQCVPLLPGHRNLELLVQIQHREFAVRASFFFKRVALES